MMERFVAEAKSQQVERDHSAKQILTRHRSAEVRFDQIFA